MTTLADAVHSFGLPLLEPLVERASQGDDCSYFAFTSGGSNPASAAHALLSFTQPAAGAGCASDSLFSDDSMLGSRPLLTAMGHVAPPPGLETEAVDNRTYTYPSLKPEDHSEPDSMKSVTEGERLSEEGEPALPACRSDFYLQDGHQRTPPRTPTNVQPASPSTPTAMSATSARASPISALQEFVQSAKTHPFSSSAVVLQWRFDTRMSDKDDEFRGIVAFLLDGIPHHCAGAWKSSKVQAKRDTAEKLLVLFAEYWAKQTPHEESNWDPNLSEIDILRIFCNRNPHRFASLPLVSVAVDDDGTRATIHLDVYGSLHTFPSVACPTEREAIKDVAERVLWYVQCPGYENAFEMQSSDVRTLSTNIPEPVVRWDRDGKFGTADAAEDWPKSAQDAARKVVETTLAFVREAMRQVFERSLAGCEGKSLCKWSYSSKAKKRCNIQLTRATAHVNVAGQSFASAWFPTREQAKLDACWKILTYLQNVHGFRHDGLEAIVRLNL